MLSRVALALVRYNLCMFDRLNQLDIGWLDLQNCSDDGLYGLPLGPRACTVNRLNDELVTIYRLKG